MSQDSIFITNKKEEQLKQRIVELLSKSDELKFLVGFFYFSGIKELYEGLKSNPKTITKVLVGLNVDRYNFGLIEYADNEQLSSDEIANKFFESVKKSLNAKDSDNKEFYEQIKFFIDQIILIML